MEARERFLALVLDRIEEREARLLVWGIVDGVFSHEELSELLNPLIDKAIDDGIEDFFSAEDVLEELRRRKWIAEVPRSGGAIGYRSRMAETVRLLQRLRQLFPKHSGSSGWQQAPSLVADFRFLRRRRRYPARDTSVEQALTMIGEAASSPALLAAVKALLTPPIALSVCPASRYALPSAFCARSKLGRTWRPSFARVLAVVRLSPFTYRR